MGSVLLAGDNASVKGRDVNENLLEEQAVASALRAQTQQAKKGVVTFTADVYRTSDSAMRLRQIVARSISHWFEPHGFVVNVLEAAEEAFHIMDFTKIRVIETLFSLLEQHCVDLIDSQEERTEFSATNHEISKELIHTCTIKQTIIALCWAFGGSMPLAPRINFAQRVKHHTPNQPHTHTHTQLAPHTHTPNQPHTHTRNHAIAIILPRQHFQQPERHAPDQRAFLGIRKYTISNYVVRVM